MADLVVTAAQVLLFTGTPIADAIAGEAFAAGKSLYLKSTDRKWYMAQADGTADEAGAQALAIALFTADAANARGTVAGAGCVVTMGAAAAPVAGKTYVVSAAAGGIAVDADIVTSTHKKTVIGLGVGSNRVAVQPVYNVGSVVP